MVEKFDERLWSSLVQDEAEQKAKIDREQANELEYADESQKEEDSDNSGGGQSVKHLQNR